ncbi:MAG: tyrosine-type recombinase/integrase [Nitrospirae bacterium]|nr:tyrosine-type recombinase/integrase [Nitrospirota bacterium]
MSGQVKDTKTVSGRREIALLPGALEALDRQKEHTALENSIIFRHPYSNEQWKHPKQIGKLWEVILRKAGVKFRNPYQTRHTYASMLLSAGENPMFVAHQMGHKDWGMIRKVYGRWLPDTVPGSGERIRSVWSQDGHKKKSG